MEPVEVFAAMQQINANFLSSRSCWRLVFHCSTMFYCVLLYMFYIVLLCSTMFYYVLFYLYPVHSFRCLSSMAGFRVGAAMMADGRAKRVHLPFGKELPL